MSSRSKLTSLNVSNTLICVLQLFCSTDGYICRLWQPALTCVLQHLKIQMQGSLSGWQPALTCVLQRNCAFVHIFIPLLATRTHMRIATFSFALAFTSAFWQPALTCVLQRQKCTILQHAEFVNAGLFVHGYLLSLGLKKSRRVSTEYRSEKHFLLRILSAKIRVYIS